MFHSCSKACAALLALASFQAVAGTPPRPDDATAPVPETRYRSADAYRPAEAPPTTPDRHWIEANRTVGSYHSMMLTMPHQSAPRPSESAQAAPQPAHGHGAHTGHDKQGHH